MCQFCEWLHSIVDKDNLKVLDPERKKDPNLNRDYVIDYYKNIGPDTIFMGGELVIENNQLMLYGNDWEECAVKLNYCPECSAPLDWAKNKLMSIAQKTVTPEVLVDDYILKRTTEFFLNKVEHNKIPCEPVDSEPEINSFKCGDYSVDIDMIGQLFIYDDMGKELYSGYNHDEAMKVLKNEASNSV